PPLDALPNRQQDQCQQQSANQRTGPRKKDRRRKIESCLINGPADSPDKNQQNEKPSCPIQIFCHHTAPDSKIVYNSLLYRIMALLTRGKGTICVQRTNVLYCNETNIEEIFR